MSEPEFMQLQRWFLRSKWYAKLGPFGSSLYIVLRNSAWRADDHGQAELRKAWSAGKIATAVSIGKLREATSMSEGTIKRTLTKLEEVGAIRQKRIKGHPPFVELGYVDGIEVYYAETIAAEVENLDPTDLGPRSHRSRIRPEKAPNLDPTDLGPRSHRSRGVDPTDLGPRSHRSIEETKEETTEETRKKQPTRTRILKKPTAEKKTWDLILNAADPEPKKIPKPTKVEDPETPGRKLDPDELAHLRSARSKFAKGAGHPLNSHEIVACWRSEFYRAFGTDDPDLKQRAARDRVAKLVATRVRKWSDGKWNRFAVYLTDMVELWKNKKPGDKFPSGTSPKLEWLLKDEGSPSGFWREWVVRKSVSKMRED